MKVIGITGGVGAGKSKVLAYIKNKYNCKIIMSDNVANDLKKKGMPCYKPVLDLLGKQILGDDGEIDKKKMAAVIFADKEKIEKINGIMHPAVNSYIISLIDEEKKANLIDYLFIEAALLIENGYDKIVDELWYIYAQESVRRARLKDTRGYSDEKIDSILKNQLSDDEFRKYCKVVIDNSAEIEETYRQIDKELGD
ncbi:MAG: dephospho-CoA kinase [Butyrivibrio sp.]|nr:dephospho-CoA kinase [Butyrivibrio sp.]